MSSPFVIVGPPPRGEGDQDPAEFYAQSMQATKSWGSSPGTATVDYVGAAPVTAGALVTIEIGAHRIVGRCQSDVDTSGSDGQKRTLEFVDLRDFLQWDWIFGAFNKPHITMVNGIRKKRYWHIYPDDFETLTKTFTDEPLLAHQIITAIFSAPTIGSPWSWDLTSWGQFPGGLMNAPIYNIDCLGGKRLDALLSEVSGKTGLVFTLDSQDEDFPYLLVWTRKGIGTIGAFPSNADNRRIGVALSGHATNIRVLGGRNRYQLLNIEMVADWASGWEQYLVPDEFVWDIYANEKNASNVRYNAYSGDTDHWIGYGDAKVRAMEITVRDYVALREARSAGSGAVFVDNRMFAGRWRMDMPAWLYIETILRRAFKPNISGLTNIDGSTVPIQSLDISDRAVCKVNVNYSTGAMTHNTDEPVDGNGLVAIKGYQVGEDLFRMAQPDRTSADFFSAANRGWGTAPFQIDDSGEGVRFIITEAPIFVSNNLMTTVGSGTGFAQTVLNAGFALATPAMRAALTFEAEAYSYWKGTYPNVSRDHVENVETLNAEYSGSAGAWTEVVYANDASADELADALADELLQRQYTYIAGGYNLKWDPAQAMEDFGTRLHSLIDRVVVQKAPTGTALGEQVDFTNERQRDSFEGERELDRRTVQNSAFPGQAELRQQQNDQKRLNSSLRQMQKTGLMAQFQKFLRGSWDKEMTQVWLNSGTGTLPVGTPITTDNASKRAIMPADSLATHAFVGVTTREGEDATKPFGAQPTGIALCRVKGPVDINDMVGIDEGETNLIGGSPTAVGKALQKIEDATVKLIRVALGAGGGGVSGQSRGEWLEDGIYSKGDEAIVSLGVNAGTYLYVYPAPSSGHEPWLNDGYWMPKVSGNALGRWM